MSVACSDGHRLYELANASNSVIFASTCRNTGSVSTTFEVCNQSCISWRSTLRVSCGGAPGTNTV